MRMATKTLTGVALSLGMLLVPGLAHATPPDWEASFGPRFSHGDDSCSEEALPFAFRYYGVDYNRVWVSSNGTLSFGKCNSAYIPALTASTPLVAPLWADLSPGTPGGIYHQVIGTAPERVFVATWYLVPEYTSRTAYNSFQVKLYEGSGRIQFGYNGLATDGFNGNGVTQRVGLYEGGATTALLVASGSAVRALDQSNVCFEPSANSYTQAKGPCVQDKNAPQVAFTSSPAAYVNRSNLEVRGVATDDAAVVSVTLRLDGAWVANLPVGPGGVVSGSVILGSEGPHTLSLEAVDGAGNRSVATAPVVYDATEPSVSLDALPALTAARVLPVTGRVADGSGVVSAELMLNGVRHPVTPAADGSVSATLELQEGENDVSLVAVDVAGNARATQASTRLDTRAPQVAVLAPTQGQVFGGASVELVLSVSDDSSVSASVQGLTRAAAPGTQSLVFPVVIPAEGPATFDVLVRDEAGNTSTASVGVVLDLSVPLLSLEHVGGRPLLEAERFGPLQGDGLLVNARVDDLSATRVEFAHGTRYVLAAGGGVLSEWVPLSEGLNVVEVSATDEAGQRAVLRRNVVYDVTPPQGTLAMAAAGTAVRGSVDLVAQATDALTGVSGVSFRVDAESWLAGTGAGPDSWELSLDTSQLSDGAHVASAALQDGVGNVRALSLPFVVDNTPPALALAELPASVRGVISLRAEASDATSAVSEVVLEVNGAPVHRCTGTALSDCETRFDTATLPDGPFVVSARASDAAGNVAAPVQRSAEADNLGPARFMVSPLPGTQVTSSVQVTVDVRDAAFSRVECFVGGISLGGSSDPRFTATVDLRDRLDGELEVRCAAEDRAGNVGIETVTVYVRNWTLSLTPASLNLRSAGAFVTLTVAGESVELLLPTESRDLRLRVPGAAAVPVLEHAASAHVRHGSGGPEVTLKLSRAALAASIRSGIAAGAIDPSRPVKLELASGSHVVGSDTVTVKH